MNWTEFLQTIQRFANTPIITIAGTPISLASVLTFGVIVLAAFWISKILQRVGRRWLSAGGVKDVGTTNTILRLLHYAVVAVGIGVALETIGIDLGALFAAGAVVAVAIGFAMQNILQNFVSGVILLGERSIKEGDVLSVDGRVVRVERLGTRATVARTRDEEQLIIPNSALVQSTVTNYTLGDSYYRIRSKVGVVYGSDMKQVAKVLDEAARTIPERDKKRDPRVLLSEFGDSAVNFDVSIWVTDPWDSPQLRSKLNTAIWWALKDAGITIAFPQLDVHFDESARLVGGA